MSQPWVSRLVARYRAEGEAAFEPRSRRPHWSPSASPPPVIQRILELRKSLSERGLDAGPQTIAWHLERQQIKVSAATISRILTRHGAVVPDPSKRPKSSYRRFEAELPNQLWQSDFTHWTLANGTDVEILNRLDDHSRYLLGCTVHRPVTGPIVLTGFRAVVAAHGVPAAVLTDNGLVFTTRFAGGRPQTCGKVERFHQTLKKWLARQPRARTLAEQQAQLDTFRSQYNDQRPHHALGRKTPAAVYTARPKATPTGVADSHERVRRDRIDDSGVVTIRYHGRLHHIGIGRTHARTRVLLLIQDLHIRVINERTGELLRDLVLDPTRDYQPQPRRPKQQGPNL